MDYPMHSTGALIFYAGTKMENNELVTLKDVFYNCCGLPRRSNLHAYKAMEKIHLKYAL